LAKFGQNDGRMDLQIKDKLFIVGGAGDGFGKAVTRALVGEGAHVLAVSRTQQKLEILKQEFPEQIDYITGDITSDKVQDIIVGKVGFTGVSGIVVNAGGPPAGGFQEISMNQWDGAWRTVVRWKISFMKKLIPVLLGNGYGRILCIESVSVKQPVDNLILSNALRPAVVGFVKTVAREVASEGVTINILAPGYHQTAAMERLFVKKSEREHISVAEAKTQLEAEIPVGNMGKPEELANMALWLLSPLSRYVTGQTFTHDGGIVKGFFG